MTEERVVTGPSMVGSLLLPMTRGIGYTVRARVPNVRARKIGDTGAEAISDQRKSLQGLGIKLTPNKSSVVEGKAAENKKKTEEAAHRRDREWFERVASGLWSPRSQAPAGLSGSDALARLVEVASRLRYRVSPDEAVAYVKALLGSKEGLLGKDERLYLRRLAATALPEIRRKALPSKSSGIQYRLTIYEERRLTRAYRGLTKLFGVIGEQIPTPEQVNKCLARFYPPWSVENAKVTKPQLIEVLTRRSPRQRAMAVLVFVVPLGEKAIQQRCYAIDRSSVRL